MEPHIAHTLIGGDRVSSNYAELYLPDAECHSLKGPSSISASETKSNKKPTTNMKDPSGLLWTSPSDLLIGLVELTPPFTSKITRGKTHEGILGIGNEMLDAEENKFLKRVAQLVSENDSAWAHILEHEKNKVRSKVKVIYDNIFLEKSTIMKEEINKFYEESILELELNMKSQLNDVLISIHANMVSELNTEIKTKLEKENKIVKKVLNDIYTSEILKINHYYKLLLKNEIHRNKKLIRQAIFERNDILNAYIRQIQAENTTSTMYVLCMERKKCKVKQFLLENHQNAEITEKYSKIMERNKIISEYQSKDEHLFKINQDWQDKVRKILKIFLKFISFSMKLLPEQSGFLLDLEKLMVLQLNEIEKVPIKVPPILVDAEKFKNIFQFEEIDKEVKECTDEPFVIVGDTSDDVPTAYGSRETIPPEVDLPFVRLQRQYVYAKCHGYNEIKTLLKANTCTCRKPQPKEPSSSSSTVSSSCKKNVEEEEILKVESSDELLIIEDFQRLNECPARECQDWGSRLSFPYLNSYVDFSEVNYKRVKAILGKIPEDELFPELFDPKEIVLSELPFAATNEPFHTVETQYSSQEDIYEPDIKCSCYEGQTLAKVSETAFKSKDIGLAEIMTKRKTSLQRLMQQNPNLLKMFTDQDYDYLM